MTGTVDNTDLTYGFRTLDELEQEAREAGGKLKYPLPCKCAANKFVSMCASHQLAQLTHDARLMITNARRDYAGKQANALRAIERAAYDRLSASPPNTDDERTYRHIIDQVAIAFGERES